MPLPKPESYVSTEQVVYYTIIPMFVQFLIFSGVGYLLYRRFRAREIEMKTMSEPEMQMSIISDSDGDYDHLDFSRN